MGKRRVGYIDFAKGICMLLVVMIHTGVPEPMPGVYAAKVALFFILSGCFFHDDMSAADFVKRKTQTLLIPFLIWYIGSYLIYYCLKLVMPSICDYTEAQGILDCFTQKQYFNGPLWFLLCLFEIQLMVFFIRRFFSQWLRWAVYLILFLCGYILAVHEIDLPLNLDTALVGILFFAIGSGLYRLKLLERCNRGYSLIVGLLLYVVYLIHPIECYMSVNRYVCSNPLDLLLILLAISLSLLFICKSINYPPPPRTLLQPIQNAKNQLALIWAKTSDLLIFIGKHTLYILLCASFDLSSD